jgi:hypothetical protein
MNKLFLPPVVVIFVFPFLMALDLSSSCCSVVSCVCSESFNFVFLCVSLVIPRAASIPIRSVLLSATGLGFDSPQRKCGGETDTVILCFGSFAQGTVQSPQNLSFSSRIQCYSMGAEFNLRRFHRSSDSCRRPISVRRP